MKEKENVDFEMSEKRVEGRRGLGEGGLSESFANSQRSRVPTVRLIRELIRAPRSKRGGSGPDYRRRCPGRGLRFR